MNTKKTIACLVYLENDGDILLLNRNNPPHKNTYISPGGKLEEYETPSAAAEREVMEETGIDIRNPRLVGMLTETSNTEYNWISYVYHTEIDTREYTSTEEGELSWYSWDELDEIEEPPPTQYVSNFVRKGEFFALDATYTVKDGELEMDSIRNEVTGEKLYENP